MKNLVNKINFIEVEPQEGEIFSPCQLEGYYDLLPEEQIALEELPSDWWAYFIDDCLKARAMDKALAFALESGKLVIN